METVCSMALYIIFRWVLHEWRQHDMHHTLRSRRPVQRNLHLAVITFDVTVPAHHYLTTNLCTPSEVSAARETHSKHRAVTLVHTPIIAFHCLYQRCMPDVRRGARQCEQTSRSHHWFVEGMGSWDLQYIIGSRRDSQHPQLGCGDRNGHFDFCAHAHSLVSRGVTL